LFCLLIPSPWIPASHTACKSSAGMTFDCTYSSGAVRTILYIVSGLRSWLDLQLAVAALPRSWQAWCGISALTYSRAPGLVVLMKCDTSDCKWLECNRPMAVSASPAASSKNCLLH
jgi:hypothetical protein